MCSSFLWKIQIHLFPNRETSLQFFNLKAWWQWLLQFFSLLLILDDKGVKKSWASNLEFGTIRILLDLNALSILSPGFKKEVFDLFNFTWHFDYFFFKDVSPEINVYKIRISVNQKQQLAYAIYDNSALQEKLYF